MAAFTGYIDRSEEKEASGKVWEEERMLKYR